jgi:release factor glutamine methyltransferase
MPLLIRDALLQARSLGVDRLDGQLLLVHVLQSVPAPGLPSPQEPQGISRTWLLAHDDRALTEEQALVWSQKLQRRAAGVPLAYVVGEQLFCGLLLQVTPDVLIPRPETEELVQWADECLHGLALSQPRVLDLGTGSGAVALAIKHRCTAAEVVATDISPAALQVARGNAQRLRLAVAFEQADWWAGLAPGLPFHLVVSNPPYIAPGDHHLVALQHEPHTALVGAHDGLGDLRRIIGGSLQHLAPGGWLLLEHGHDQAEALHHLLLQAGFDQPQTRHDLAGLPRCTGARRPLIRQATDRN